MKLIHDHHSTTGQQDLAEACIAEARKRRRPELAGDFFCRAHHESKDGKRNGFTARQVAWQAAGHVLQERQRRASRTPSHQAGDSVNAVTRTDRGDAFIRRVEFAYDLVNAIGAQLAVQRLQMVLWLRQLTRRQLKPQTRLPMPAVILNRGPLAEMLRRRITN